MMVGIDQFVAIALIGFLGAMSPGPDFMLVSKHSLIHSRRIGIYTTVGISFGILLHVSYCIAGIALVIAHSPFLFSILKFIGAAYLIQLGVKSIFCRARAAHPTNTVFANADDSHRRGLINSGDSAMSALQAVKNGFFVNAFNPQSTMFFLSVFSQFVDVDTPLGIKFIYGGEFIAIGFLWFTMLSVFLSHHAIRSRLENYHNLLEQVTGMLFIGIGLQVMFASSVA